MRSARVGCCCRSFALELIPTHDRQDLPVYLHFAVSGLVILNVDYR